MPHVTLGMSMAVEVRQQKSLTLILARGFASNLSMPMSVHDPTGTIVFYNESAEAAFGVTFAEMGELSAAEWTARYSPEEADGTPIPLEELPVGVALKERRPAHRTVCFTRPDNVGYVAEVTAFPLMGREEELVGAVRIFWDDAASPRRRVSGPPDVAAEQDGMARHAGPKDLVLILARELASNLATPIYLADARRHARLLQRAGREDWWPVVCGGGGDVDTPMGGAAQAADCRRCAPSA